VWLTNAWPLVCSLFGVILIARPTSLFGPSANTPEISALTDVDSDDLASVSANGKEEVTAEQRMVAVGCVFSGSPTVERITLILGLGYPLSEYWGPQELVRIKGIRNSTNY
jgi:hypothetical protein